VARDRRRAIYERARAASDRAESLEERAAAVEERMLCAYDRSVAVRERAEAARDRAAAHIDELTHVRRRGAGMEQLVQEIDRARRCSGRLVVAFVDVDGLKRVNDTRGHMAGDALLRAVADCLNGCLRSYDLIMRYGGDEFVCVLPDADAGTVLQRFASVASSLAASPTGGSITVGFAVLLAADSAEDLIRRADDSLLEARGRSLTRR
jgi:diguanylate cyclase (GGDEF)-like protein